MRDGETPGSKHTQEEQAANFDKRTLARGQGRLMDNSLVNLFKVIWQQGKPPLALGAVLGAITCTTVGIAFGTGHSGIFLMASIGGSFLLIPVLIVAISHFLDS